MEILYKIDDHFIVADFNKVTNITKIETNNSIDYKIQLDGRKSDILISDMIHIVDNENRKHTDSFLEVCEKYYERKELLERGEEVSSDDD